MSIQLIKGDVRRANTQMLMLGLNAEGQAEVSPLETLLRDEHPVFFSEYRRMGRNRALETGQLWFFQDSSPKFIGAILREAANGVTRLRHIDSICLSLQRDYQREGIESLAIAPLCPEPEWSMVKPVLLDRLATLPVTIVLYEEHVQE